jgi:hypothetical protein
VFHRKRTFPTTLIISYTPTPGNHNFSDTLLPIGFIAYTITIGIIRYSTLKKDKQHNGPMKKDKQRSTKLYTENKRSSNTNLTKTRSELRNSEIYVYYVYLAVLQINKINDRNTWKLAWKVCRHKIVAVMSSETKKMVNYCEIIINKSCVKTFFLFECNCWRLF